VVEFEVTAAFAVLDTPSRAISVSNGISSKEAVGNRELQLLGLLATTVPTFSALWVDPCMFDLDKWVARVIGTKFSCGGGSECCFSIYAWRRRRRPLEETAGAGHDTLVRGAEWRVRTRVARPPLCVATRVAAARLCGGIQAVSVGSSATDIVGVVICICSVGTCNHSNSQGQSPCRFTF